MTKPGELSLFIPINKIDEEQRLVYGQVAAEVLDNSGEMFDYDGSKEYFEKWSENAYSTSLGKSYGNVRVMHTSKVAGLVSQPLAFNDEDKTIEACAKVVDDAEWEMVKAGGYTGFSMGGRYVSRAKKSDGITRYVADPVEISLVDKPCIPTATFAVVKADGVTEDRRFREDLYKSDTGDNVMTVYTPTNDEVLPVARALAKAAGHDEDKWVDFVEEATADLIAKHTAAEGAVNKADDAEHTDEDCKVEDCDKCAAAKADVPDSEEGDDGDKGTGDGDEEEEDEEAKAAAKADSAEAPQLQQGWQAKDGTFFVKKADAVAHNETLAKGEAAPSLSDQLAALRDTASAVIKGDVIEAPAEGQPTLKAATIAAIAEPLAKFKEFADNTLVKGMWTLRRLAELIAMLDEVHCSVSYEEAWEDDNTSALPKMLLDNLTSLGRSLVAMANEEVAEMVASASALTTENNVTSVGGVDDAIMELSASTLGLEKSAFTSDLVDRLEKRAPVQTVDSAETLAKVTALTEERDTLEKRAVAAEGELSKLEPLIKGLQDDMAKILAMPREKAPTTRVVSKSDDARGVTGEPEAKPGVDLNKFSADQLADAAIRLSHQHGRHFIVPTTPVGGQ